MAQIRVLRSDQTVATENDLILTAPFNMKLPTANVTFKVDTATSKVTVTSNAFALFVTLTTQAAGRFSDNSFILLPNVAREIDFVPFGKYFDSNLFSSTLRVEHAKQYL